jgi:hypothetical protein
MFWNQFYGVDDSNLAPLDHVTIQREHAAEFLHDTRERLTVLFQAVWVKRCHEATPTKALDPDDDVSNPQALPRPRTLSQTFDRADHKIRSESSAIMAKGGDRSIRRDQQGQHIEALDRLIPHQPGAQADDTHHILANLGIAL